MNFMITCDELNFRAVFSHSCKLNSWEKNVLFPPLSLINKLRTTERICNEIRLLMRVVDKLLIFFIKENDL